MTVGVDECDREQVKMQTKNDRWKQMNMKESAEKIHKWVI